MKLEGIMSGEKCFNKPTGKKEQSLEIFGLLFPQSVPFLKASDILRSYL